jgi:hypothetical protein
MGQEENNQTYSHALNAARVELGQIIEQFDALRVRSVQLEAAVQALRPIAFDEDESTDEAVRCEPEASITAPQPVREVSSGLLNSFQSRIERALGIPVTA